MVKNVTKISKSLPKKKAEEHGFMREFEDRMRHLEQRFESLLPGSWTRSGHLAFPEWMQAGLMDLKTPKVDIIDREHDVLIKAEIPGAKKEDIDVSLTDTTVTIKGCTSEQKKEEEGDYFRSETLKGAFSRTLTLPAEVDGSKAKSTFRNSMLEVTAPKSEGAKRHTVKVS